MQKIQASKKFGVCNDCGLTQSSTAITELRFSVNGGGWTTVMLCRKCMERLRDALNAELGKREQ